VRGSGSSTVLMATGFVYGNPNFQPPQNRPCLTDHPGSKVLTFLVLPFWYLLTRVVPDIFQKSCKTVVCVCVCVLTDHPEIWQRWLRLWLLHLFQIWCKSAQGGLWANAWNISNFFIYTFFVNSPAGQTHRRIFAFLWLKWHGLNESAFWGFHWYSTQFRGQIIQKTQFSGCEWTF